jgi:hypothetical protein
MLALDAGIQIKGSGKSRVVKASDFSGHVHGRSGGRQDHYGPCSSSQ